MRKPNVPVSERRPDDYFARIVEREERRDRHWFAAQLIGLCVAAAAILGWKELQFGVQALPLYITELAFFVTVALIAWHREK